MELRPIDPTSESELKTILALFRTVFAREMTPEFYRWRFLRNPFGPPCVSLLWDGEVLAGHYSASPMQSWIEGPVATAQSMTTMTHPSYRNRDVFTTLARDLFARMESAGIRGIWGYPNTKSHYGFVQRLGWRDLGLIPTFSLEAASGSPDELVELSAPPSMLDRLFARSVGSRAFLAARTAAYFDWRYRTNPATTYRYFTVRGGEDDVFLVTKVYSMSSGDRALEVVDCLYGERPDALATALRAASAWARANEIRLVRTWASLSEASFPFLEKLGFAPHEPLVYLGLRMFGFHRLPERLWHADAWHMSMADSDNY